MSFTVEKKKNFQLFRQKNTKGCPDIRSWGCEKVSRKSFFKKHRSWKVSGVSNLGWFGKENPEASDKGTKFCDFVKMELTQQGQITDVTQHSFAPDKIQHKYNISSRIRSSREVHGRSHHLRGDQLGNHVMCTPLHVCSVNFDNGVQQ
jgi:hypothetical protein